jgi:hypothetical protein
MSTLKKQFQRIAHEYMRQHHVDYIDLHEVAEWAIRTNRWEPQKSALIRQCKELLGSALREEYFTDSQGRRVRAMHVIVKDRNGKQTSIWGDMRTADRNHMALSFQQRRRQIVGDCRQLKMDIDSFNENYNKGSWIQTSFDFTHDLEEDEIVSTHRRSSTSGSSRPSSDSSAPQKQLTSSLSISRP